MGSFIKLRGLGSLIFSLGTGIFRSSDESSLCQRKSALEMSDSSVHITPNLKLLEEDRDLVEDHELYNRIPGWSSNVSDNYKVIYITYKLCQYSSAPCCLISQRFINQRYCFVRVILLCILWLWSYSKTLLMIIGMLVLIVYVLLQVSVCLLVIL